MLDGVRISVCLIFFIYASWSDLKKREVSNKVWAVLAPLGFALTFLQFYLFSPDMLQILAFSFVVTSAVSVALFYAGAFGGADAKALICLSLVLPYPVHLLQPIGYSPPLFPITVFTNAVLLAASTVLYAIMRNILWKYRTGKRIFEGFEAQSMGRKALAFLCGYKVNINGLEKMKHFYPLEDLMVTETGKTERRLLVFPSEEKKEKVVEKLIDARDKGELGGDVWITPGLPLLVFITAGLIIALTLGDIIWVALGLVL
jgi:preflagellin peptidase FlaK